MLDILDRGSDGVHKGDILRRTAVRSRAAPAAARASVVPAAKLAAGAMDAVSVVGAINGAEDADAAGFCGRRACAAGLGCRNRCCGGMRCGFRKVPRAAHRWAASRSFMIPMRSSSETASNKI